MKKFRITTRSFSCGKGDKEHSEIIYAKTEEEAKRKAKKALPEDQIVLHCYAEEISERRS